MTFKALYLQNNSAASPRYISQFGPSGPIACNLTEVFGVVCDFALGIVTYFDPLFTFIPPTIRGYTEVLGVDVGPIGSLSFFGIAFELMCIHFNRPSFIMADPSDSFFGFFMDLGFAVSSQPLRRIARKSR